jgi:hypothetical protein
VTPLRPPQLPRTTSPATPPRSGSRPAGRIRPRPGDRAPLRSAGGGPEPANRRVRSTMAVPASMARSCRHRRHPGVTRPRRRPAARRSTPHPGRQPPISAAQRRGGSWCSAPASSGSRWRPRFERVG